MAAMDPKSFVNWSPESLADNLIKGLPDGLREPCKARIISNGVTGQALLNMIRELSKPGSGKMQDHATFKQIFDSEWVAGDAWRHWGGVLTGVRDPKSAMTNFFMKLINENASVVVAKAQKRIFEIIDPRVRAYEFDAYYAVGEAWCIASGQQALVRSQNGGGQHMVGFYIAPEGWQRLALQVLDDGSKNFEGNEWEQWHKAYHGTRGEAVKSIVDNGLMQPGAVVGGVKVETLHGAAGAKGDKKPIYLSPCLEYSAHHVFTSARHDEVIKMGALHLSGPIEAPLLPEKAKAGVGDASQSSGLSFEDVVAAENTFAQFVFEVRVRPGSFTVQGNTIGSWPKRGEYHGPSPKSTFMQYDETCHSDLLEWLVLDPKDVVCTGVMIRQLPHGLMDASLNRERYMRQLTGWDEAAGSQRPRTWGKGCAGELPNGVAWEWNNEPSNGQTLSYADGLRWERYAPEMLPRLSRDYPEICGWAPVPIRSRDPRPCPSSMHVLTTAPAHFPTGTLPRSPPSSRPPTSRISASSSWVSRRARRGHTRSILGRSGEAMRPMGLSSVVQTATRSRTGGGAPSDASRCRRRIMDDTKSKVCVRHFVRAGRG
jgi:hypothetical protein